MNSENEHNHASADAENARVVPRALQDPRFFRVAKGFTRRGILRRIALTAISAVAITIGQWTFAKPLLVYARSCDICVGNCHPCASYLALCPSPTGACSCGQAACVCWAWENQGVQCTPPLVNVVILSCEFPCGCQTYCEAC